MAERLGVSSTLDAQVTLYEQYTTTETVTVLEGGVETQKSFSVTRYRVIARNDNYYSDDAYLEMYLKQGTYFVGVSASGNNQYDPNIDSSGIGGVSDGVYELRVNFNPGGVNPDDPNTFKGDGTTHLTDTNQTFFDGDADGVPGGVYDYWFNVQKHEAVPSALAGPRRRRSTSTSWPQPPEPMGRLPAPTMRSTAHWPWPGRATSCESSATTLATIPARWPISRTTGPTKSAAIRRT